MVTAWERSGSKGRMTGDQGERQKWPSDVQLSENDLPLTSHNRETRRLIYEEVRDRKV